jgi:hypothetical protein
MGKSARSNVATGESGRVWKKNVQSGYPPVNRVRGAVKLTLILPVERIQGDLALRTIAIVTLVAASAIAFSAVAADATQSQQQQPKPQAGSTAKPDDLDRVVCKSEEETGTRLPPKKTCHTKREWNDIATETRQMLDANATHMQGTPK